jgi:hypothetical protein
MKGWAMLAPAGWREADVRKDAINIARDFCRTLPKKA